jgi:hypothetical protein
MAARKRVRAADAVRFRAQTAVAVAAVALALESTAPAAKAIVNTAARELKEARMFVFLDNALTTHDLNEN